MMMLSVRLIKFIAAFIRMVFEGKMTENNNIYPKREQQI